MISLQELYRIAHEQNVMVDYFPLKKREALAIMDDAGQCAIAIDPHKIRSEFDERNKLVHELGHCCTGSFYNQYSNYDCRKRHENRADKWAIERLIPFDDLVEAFASGHWDIWDLADYFNVTEEFIKKAVCFHIYGNVAIEIYYGM